MSGRRLILRPPGDLYEQVCAMPAAHWGPAMQALTPRLRAYCIALVEYRLSSPQAAKAAGSKSESEGGLRVIAHRWAHSPGVAQAARELIERRILETGPEMLSIVEGLARSAEKDETRLKAATGLLDRAGFAAAQRIEVSHDHQVTVTLTNEQLQADLERMLGKPLSAEALAALPPPADREIVDADFEAIPATPPEDEWAVP
jgi:hypothetical protein